MSCIQVVHFLIDKAGGLRAIVAEDLTRQRIRRTAAKPTKQPTPPPDPARFGRSR